MQVRSRPIKGAFLLLCAALLSSCGVKEVTSAREKVHITFGECEHFSFARTSYEVTSGEDFRIRLSLDEGYTVDTCSYDNYSYDDETCILSLYAVSYPERIFLTARENDLVITYDLNGGTFLDGRTDTTYTETRNKGMHLRYNTSLGKDIHKEGCLLRGWNTKADGSGEETGIGSRITIASGEEKTLYAEWVPYESPENFDYVLKEGEISLTSYKGDASSLILPDYMDGKPVTSIAAGFMENKTLEELMLPETMKTVEDGAFTDCFIAEYSFFDTLITVTDESFEGCTVKKWHISAGDYPQMISSVDHTQFAEDIDRLMLNQDRKKMIFYAGCSMSYGLKSALVQKEYPDYFVQDLGVIGGTDAYFQFQIIRHFVGKGDVFIHAPEVASGYQLMSLSEGESRMFCLVEGNYDLFDYVDASSISGLFTAWKDFQISRDGLEHVSYDARLTTYNSYGDICISRPTSGQDTSYTTPHYGYDLSLLTQASLDGLKEVYGWLQEKGATVLFSFAPTNYHGLTEEQLRTQAYFTFESFYKMHLPDFGVKVISKVQDYLYYGRYFYDKDYHLNDEGATMRTNYLIEDLKNAGI